MINETENSLERTIWMPYMAQETHFWRTERKVWREGKAGIQEQNVTGSTTQAFNKTSYAEFCNRPTIAISHPCTLY